MIVKGKKKGKAEINTGFFCAFISFLLEYFLRFSFRVWGETNAKHMFKCYTFAIKPQKNNAIRQCYFLAVSG